VFPTKVYECLATGKPVVATPLPDLQGELSKHVYLASDAKDFIEVLRRLPELETQERVQARLALARNNSWNSRCDLVSRELERLLHA
jgi:glycosyltransferase involved in cell wall biosynthesis